MVYPILPGAPRENVRSLFGCDIAVNGIDSQLPQGILYFF